MSGHMADPDRQGDDPDDPAWLRRLEEDEAKQFQFSLFELLVLTAAVAAIFSFISTVSRFLPGGMSPANFAGLLGLVALVCLVVIALVPNARRIVIIGWWVLVGLYLMSCVFALTATK